MDPFLFTLKAPDKKTLPEAFKFDKTFDTSLVHIPEQTLWV